MTDGRSSPLLGIGAVLRSFWWLLILGALVGLFIGHRQGPSGETTGTTEIAVVDDDAWVVGLGLPVEFAKPYIDPAVESRALVQGEPAGVNFTSTFDAVTKTITLVATGSSSGQVTTAAQAAISASEERTKVVRDGRAKSALAAVDATIAALPAGSPSATTQNGPDVTSIARLLQLRSGYTSYLEQNPTVKHLTVLSADVSTGDTSPVVTVGGAVAGAAAVALALILVALLDPRVRRVSDLELLLGDGSVLCVLPTSGRRRSIGVDDLAGVVRANDHDPDATSQAEAIPVSFVAADVGTDPSELAGQVTQSLVASGDGSERVVRAVERDGLGRLGPGNACVVVATVGATRRDEVDVVVRSLSNSGCDVIGVVLDGVRERSYAAALR